MSWHVAGWAYLVSIVLDAKSAQLLMVVLCLVFLLFAGVDTPISSTTDFFTQFVSLLSPNRWLVQDLFVCWTFPLSPAWRWGPPSYFKIPSKESVPVYLSKLYYSEVLKVYHLPAWDVIMNFCEFISSHCQPSLHSGLGSHPNSLWVLGCVMGGHGRAGTCHSLDCILIDERD